MFNAQWIQKNLSFDHPTIQIETNAFFKDEKNLVDEKTDIFEVDLFFTKSFFNMWMHHILGNGRIF